MYNGEMSDNIWSKLHDDYEKRDWINKPSLFAETSIDYFPESGKLLDLGAGVGQDSVYFTQKGYEVTATDLDTTKLEENIAENNLSVNVQRVDLRETLPFENNSYDVVYAHLSLHYFDKFTTEEIFAEILRILKPGGILAFFTNSVNDPEYNSGRQIEPDYFEIDGTPKRYLSVKTAEGFAHDFEIIIADDKGETYKDSVRGIHNLIRFVGRKPIGHRVHGLVNIKLYK
jgi:SAM-dependent methyltransferase